MGTGRLAAEAGFTTGDREALSRLIAEDYRGHTFEHHLRFCDIYLRRNAQWRLYITQATPMEGA